MNTLLKRINGHHFLMIKKIDCGIEMSGHVRVQLQRLNLHICKNLESQRYGSIWFRNWGLPSSLETILKIGETLNHQGTTPGNL